MNKKYMYSFIALFAVGLVTAGYVVSTLTLNVGVAEPFTVQYAVLGDAGTYVDGDCASATGWFDASSASIPAGDMYPMESRKVCVRISNAGEVDIPYTISADVLNDNTAGDCASAFSTPYDLSGSATAETDSFKGVVVTPSADSTPVSGCEIQISVARG